MSIVIGHRGARNLAPENTLEAIQVAANCGADFVEVDVRISKDGSLVVMHDDTVDRTTNGSGKVEGMTLAELKQLEVGGKAGEQIPTLKEAATFAEGLGMGIVVEMKDEGLEELVAREVEGRKAIVSSFYHASVREIKDLADVKTGIIISSLPTKPVDLALWANADVIFPRRVNPNLFKRAHREGIEVYPWVINDPEEARWMRRLGADGLVSDNPCSIRKAADEPVRNMSAEECEYYPCHNLPDQVCTHCFCPLYPCKDPELGKFIRSKRGKRIWSCVDCTLVHKSAVAKYLTEHPDATTEELKAVDRRKISAE